MYLMMIFTCEAADSTVFAVEIRAKIAVFECGCKAPVLLSATVNPRHCYMMAPLQLMQC